MENYAELFLTDEALTDGLTDEEARELLSWLLGLAEEADEAHLPHLKRLGQEVARLSREYGVPVDEVIALVELAWGEVPPAALKA
ncbi:MAG: hypothetical protein C4300_01015 [Thermus sp.]|uniref:hypothetical protein n=1 Tax=Thermus sp. TaxID=275 RepID=UPI00331AFE07